MDMLRGEKGDGLSQNTKYALTAAGFVAAAGIGYYLFSKRRTPAVKGAPSVPPPPQTQQVKSPKKASAPTPAAPAKQPEAANANLSPEEAMQEIVGRDFLVFAEKEFMLPPPDAFVAALQADGRANNPALKQAQVAIAVSLKQLEVGKTDEGFDQLQKAMANVSSQNPSEDVEEAIATLLLAISFVHGSLERLDLAEEKYNEAVSKWESIHGDKNKHLLTFLKSLGLCKRYRLHTESSSKKKEAKAKDIQAIFEKGYHVALQAYGDSDEKTLQMQSCQADSLMEQKKYDEAERLYKLVRTLCLSTRKSTCLVAAATYDLAKCLRKQKGRENDALEKEEELQSLMLEMYDGDMDKTVYLMCQLATLNRFQKNYDVAESLYRRSLELAKSKKSKGSEMGALLNNLGETLRERQKFDEAIEVFEQARKLLEEAKGQNDPEVASILASTGRLKTDTKKFEEAESYYIKSLDILQKVSHPNVVLVMALYGRHLRLVGGREREAQQIEANVAHLEEFFGVKVTVQ